MNSSASAPAPRSRRRAVLVAALVLLGAAALAWVGWQRRAAGEDAHTLVLYGNVEQRQVALAFIASERITELTVHEGDRVSPGQLLGRNLR